MSRKAGELHLILIWERARHLEQDILADIAQHLTILECYDIGWTKKHVAENLMRFYGVKLGKNSRKERECGSGRFLLVTVWDSSPNYRYTVTSRGSEHVNVNIFSLKQKYRNWLGGGSRIHTTNSSQETDHDITLLLGVCCEDYLKTAPEQWDGSRKMLDRDLPGCGGWQSLQELFYVLNHTLNYAVLRNHECLPSRFRTAEHGDIDLLVDDVQNAALLLHAEKVFKKPYRVHFSNIVNNKIGGVATRLSIGTSAVWGMTTTAASGRRRCWPRVS